MPPGWRASAGTAFDLDGRLGDADVAQALLDRRAEPGLERRRLAAGDHEQPQPRACLHDLELDHVAVAGDDRELQRVHGDGRGAGAGQLEHVVAASVDRADAPQRAPARAGVGVERDGVGDLEADQRLGVVERGW